MLTYLSIANFTLVEHLELYVERGMTAITGETGTGKSIVLDALTMALGARTNADCVRAGCSKADITACFSLSASPDLQQWLVDNELVESVEEAPECLLRRVITSDGRSRTYINGQAVTLQQLRSLSSQLIAIHSQHAHQSLLKKEAHRRLLDEYAGQCDLAQTVYHHYQQWQQAEKQFLEWSDNANAANARYQLLHYQVEELNVLNVKEGELTTLEEEQQRLSNGEKILRYSHQISAICDSDDQCLRSLLNNALQLLTELPSPSQSMENAQQLLNDALINVEEAADEIKHYIDTVELNPDRLQQVEERLSAIYEMARKHKVNPEELTDLQRQLSGELTAINNGDDQIKHLEELSNRAQADYRKFAVKLSERRKSASKKLTKEVNKYLHQLKMNNAEFVIELLPLSEGGTSQGLEEVVFLISTNPGQEPRPLAKIVSGGELSRISLAIQMSTAETSTIPSLVFDEVDVGIGGATADTVGSTLAALGQYHQVLCVTHLAQVASKATHHWQVSKSFSGEVTHTCVRTLNDEEKIEEIARMISGSELTDQSIAHAQQMLEQKS